MKRCHIRVSTRNKPQTLKSQYSFGGIHTGLQKPTPGERLESLIADQDEIAVTLKNLLIATGLHLTSSATVGGGRSAVSPQHLQAIFAPEMSFLKRLCWCSNWHGKDILIHCGMRSWTAFSVL